VVLTESLKALFYGGIVFLAPDHERMGEPAIDNKVFILHQKSDEKWLR